MSNLIVFGAIIGLSLLTGWLLVGEAFSNANRRINADLRRLDEVVR